MISPAMLCRSSLIVLTLCLLPAQANADDWDWAFSPYLWAAGISGDGQGGEVPLDFGLETSDILNMLDGAFMGRLRASRDKNTFYGDLIFISLDPEADARPLTGRIDADLDAVVLEAGYSRQFSDTAPGLGWVVGLRYYDIDLRVVPTLLPTFDGGKSWTDGLAGLQYKRDLGGKWRLEMQADLGTGGSDLSYGLVASASREFSSGDRFLIGYKALGVDLSDDDRVLDPFALDIVFQGIAIAYVFD